MITIALTARNEGRSSVICLELRPDPADRLEVWSVMNRLLDGLFDGGQTRMTGKVTKDGARTEIETSLAWAAVIDQLRERAAKFAGVEWTFTSPTLVSLCARTA